MGTRSSFSSNCATQLWGFLFLPYNSRRYGLPNTLMTYESQFYPASSHFPIVDSAVSERGCGTRRLRDPGKVPAASLKSHIHMLEATCTCRKWQVAVARRLGCRFAFSGSLKKLFNRISRISSVSTDIYGGVTNTSSHSHMSSIAALSRDIHPTPSTTRTFGLGARP